MEKTHIGNTLRDIAIESTVNKAEALSLRLIATEYDILKASHAKLVTALEKMVTQFAIYTPQLNQEKCWEVIQAKKVLKEAKEII